MTQASSSTPASRCPTTTKATPPDERKALPFPGIPCPTSRRHRYLLNAVLMGLGKAGHVTVGDFRPNHFPPQHIGPLPHRMALANPEYYREPYQPVLHAAVKFWQF